MQAHFDLNLEVRAGEIVCMLGNFIYWIYITGLPVGPIWFLHFFNTVVALLMLALYLRFEKGCRIATLPQCANGFPACITG